MPQYMIQTSHDPGPKEHECARVLKAFAKAGSHYLINANWGCLSDVHTAWIIVEADDDYQARLMAPPIIRRTAQVIRLNKFTPEEIRETHAGPDSNSRAPTTAKNTSNRQRAPLRNP